jgi:hypothetical protein
MAEVTARMTSSFTSVAICDLLCKKERIGSAIRMKDNQSGNGKYWTKP